MCNLLFISIFCGEITSTYLTIFLIYFHFISNILFICIRFIWACSQSYKCNKKLTSLQQNTKACTRLLAVCEVCRRAPSHRPARPRPSDPLTEWERQESRGGPGLAHLPMIGKCKHARTHAHTQKMRPHKIGAHNVSIQVETYGVPSPGLLSNSEGWYKDFKYLSASWAALCSILRFDAGVLVSSRASSLLTSFSAFLLQVITESVSSCSWTNRRTN